MNFTDALGSELIKLRSIRSTPLMLLTGAVIIVGLCAMGTGLGPDDMYTEPGALTRIAFLGVLFGQIALAAVAALTYTAEHESGGVRTTLAAVPRRGRLVAAKAVGVGLVSLAFGAVVSAVSVSTAKVTLAARGAAVEPVTWDTVLRPTIGNALYLCAFGVLAFGVGVLLRNTAGTLTALIGGTIILPLTFSALGDVGQFLSRWWPTNAGQSITRVGYNGLPPYEGFAVLCVTVALTLAAAALVFDRRDP